MWNRNPVSGVIGVQTDPAPIDILLNPIEFGAYQAAIEALMADATAAVRNRFSAVWVLWKDTAYCTWSGGQKSAEICCARSVRDRTAT